uniref:Uncharacterized protein n=1 Tax=Salix viminalis TaxID=40686 RepID=A0A6N2LP81_SALVM
MRDAFASVAHVQDVTKHRAHHLPLDSPPCPSLASPTVLPHLPLLPHRTIPPHVTLSQPSLRPAKPPTHPQINEVAHPQLHRPVSHPHIIVDHEGEALISADSIIELVVNLKLRREHENDKEIERMVLEKKKMELYVCMEVKGAKKFRYAGIEPALKFKYDKICSNIVATGEYAWAPSSGVQGGGNCSQPGTNDAVDLEEGSGDSEEDRNPASGSHIAWLVGGVNISSSSNTLSSGKRKEMDANEGRATKKKKKMASIDVQLLSNISTKSDSPSLHMDKQGCSIHEVMAEIHSIPGIHADHDLHDFATKIMIQCRRREMWGCCSSVVKIRRAVLVAPAATVVNLLQGRVKLNDCRSHVSTGKMTEAKQVLQTLRGREDAFGNLFIRSHSQLNSSFASMLSRFWWQF